MRLPFRSTVPFRGQGTLAALGSEVVSLSEFHFSARSGTHVWETPIRLFGRPCGEGSAKVAEWDSQISRTSKGEGPRGSFSPPSQDLPEMVASATSSKVVSAIPPPPPFVGRLHGRFSGGLGSARLLRETLDDDMFCPVARQSYQHPGAGGDLDRHRASAISAKTHPRLHSDNMTVVICLTRRGSARSMPLNRGILPIRHLLSLRLLFSDRLSYRGTANVVADGLSRNLPLPSEWSLDDRSFRLIRHKKFVPGIDLFATWGIRKLQLFFSPAPDPWTIGVDAFSVDWSRWDSLYISHQRA